MVAPAYLLLGGGALLGLYALQRRATLKLQAPSVASSQRTTVDSSVRRFAPPGVRVLNPTKGSASSSLAQWAPQKRGLRPAPFTGAPMLAWADMLTGQFPSGRSAGMLPITKSGHLARKLISIAAAQAKRNGSWAQLADAVRVGVVVGASQGFDVTTLAEANRAVDVAKAVLFSPEWTAGMSETQIRKQAGDALLAIWAGGLMPAAEPDVLVPADRACDVVIPVMGEPYRDLFDKTGGDWGGGCAERMRRLRLAWDRLWARGGPDGAPMSELRRTFSDMARERAGAMWSNASATAAPLPGDLRAFIVGIGAVAGLGVGGMWADRLLAEAER